MVTSSTLDSEPSALSMAGVCPPSSPIAPLFACNVEGSGRGYIGCECLAIWKSRDARSHASGYCCRLCDPSLVISGCNICNAERRVGCSGNPAFYSVCGAACRPRSAGAGAGASRAGRRATKAVMAFLSTRSMWLSPPSKTRWMVTHTVARLPTGPPELAAWFIMRIILCIQPVSGQAVIPGKHRGNSFDSA